jgi:TatD DNase family protein
VTTTPSAWNGTSALAVGSSRIRTGLGLHPQLAHERKFELALFERLLSEARYVGEVGLDGAPEFKRHWDDQLEVFSRILNACQAAGGRILSIHSRRAASAVLDLLEEKREAGTPILHWFSGTQRELARASALGCWFSVGPAMLANEKGRALASRMPRDRILTETDGPFAKVGERSALPWDVQRAVAGLAALWNEPEDIVEKQLLKNLRTLVIH